MLLGVLVTLSVLLYPTVSSYVNSITQSRVVTEYFDDMSAMSKEDMQPYIDAAYEYNRFLAQKLDRFEFTDEENARYNEMMETGQGVMGILVIDKINVKLSIYHGTAESVLQVGLGHMRNSSLPIGGTGSHAFITGHRGVPSSTLLTDLDKMKEGDSFMIFTLGETLTYQIDLIQTVEPHEVEKMEIDPESDYCTLVTCTPYGINSHRLLVRGKRVETTANASGSTYLEALYADAKRLQKPMIILIFIVPVLPALIIYLIFKCRRIHKGGYVQ